MVFGKNNQRVTYEELNLHNDWKRRQKEPQDSKSSDAVTEQEITYAELNFQNSCQDPQGNDQQLHSRDFPLPPEQLTAEVLGITCLVLLSTLVKTIILISYAEIERPELNNASLMTRTQKAYNCNHCPEEWFIYSNSCYYISYEKKTWKESVMSCVSKKSKLLYIDNPEEMNIFVAFDILPWSGPFNESNDDVQMWSGGSVFSSKS
ncbi:NKG2-F type II integral membrane protein-like [Sorex fumeus]|uniref:NKG2-F type II integral membrane protein-like n=1 Tax=Sorex fumeus TaxID=62283 RepID=UPI0024ADF1CB|nr:NKG2-F type II integral membrane protein-like [Sorex fumeus]